MRIESLRSGRDRCYNLKSILLQIRCRLQQTVINDSIHDCSSRAAAEAEKGGGAAGGSRLLLVAGRRPVGGALAPVARPPRQPFESAVTGEAFEDPAEVIVVVRRRPQLGAVGHDLRQNIERLAQDEAALVVAPFRPGIGKQYEHPIDRGRRQRRDQQPRVVGKDPDVVDAPLLDLREKLDDPVLENLAADKTDLRMPFGLLRQMLAAAEADLKPYRSPRGAEQNAGIETAGRRNSHGKLGQQSRNEGLLSGAKRPSPATTEEESRGLRLRRGSRQKLRRSSSARSSLSQEKPPSGSACRPKWPYAEVRV